MTDLQIKAHKAQMDDYRREFYQYFKPAIVADLSGPSRPRIEQLCWQFFLHGKGVKV